MAAHITKFYEDGAFPRRMVVSDVPLWCGVYQDRLTIGCVAISKTVIENLLAEMESEGTPEYGA